MKKIFNLSNLIPLLLVVYITKSFIMPPSFFDFGVISLMSFGFFYKLKLDKQIQEDKDVILKMVSSYKEDTLDKIAQFEEKYKEDFNQANIGQKTALDKFEVRYTNAFKQAQISEKANRDEIETKLSTLNLALQHRSNAKPTTEKTQYGWG